MTIMRGDMTVMRCISWGVRYMRDIGGMRDKRELRDSGNMRDMGDMGYVRDMWDMRKMGDMRDMWDMSYLSRFCWAPPTVPGTREALATKHLRGSVAITTRLSVLGRGLGFTSVARQLSSVSCAKIRTHPFSPPQPPTHQPPPQFSAHPPLNKEGSAPRLTTQGSAPHINGGWVVRKVVRKVGVQMPCKPPTINIATALLPLCFIPRA